MSLAEPTLITIRESLEAFLIISIFAGLVVKLGFPQARKYLLWGAGAALAASVVIGVIIDRTMRELFAESGSAELVEGAASLVAVGILTYMIVWMYRHTLDLVAGLRNRAHEALAAGRPGLLFAIAFVAVAREGLETVFFFASLAPSTSATTLVLAALLGVSISATLAYLVFSGIVRLNIKRFFAASGVLLIFFAGGLLVTSLHEFTEVGLVPQTPTAWNTEPLVDQQGLVGAFVKAVFGYREAPTVLEAAAYWLYVLGMGVWYVWGLLKRAGRSVLLRPPEPTPQA